MEEETIKEKFKRRIARDAIKSEINGETVYLKKSKMPIMGGDWVQIHPPVNEDGSWNWFNLLFGGKRNLRLLILFLIIVAMVFYSYYEIFNSIELILNEPCVSACFQ